MRITRAAKEQLREEILLNAISFLKESGRSGAPVDKIMENVGLTSGALYSHFKSKNDFFDQVILRELERKNKDFALSMARLGGRAALRMWVDEYLSEKHLVDVGHGCVFSALGTDMKRTSPDARERFERKMSEGFEILAGGLETGTLAERVAKIKFIFSSVLGAMVLARSGHTKEMSRSLLKTTQQHLHLMLD